MPLLFSSLTLAAFSFPPSFLLPQSLWQIWQKLFSLFFCFIRLQWVPRHSFLLGTTRLMSWSDKRGVLLNCPLQSLVVFLLLSLVFTLLFSRTGGVLSHLNSLTRRFPQFPPRNLCSLVSVLSRLRCNGHSLPLRSYLSKIAESKIIPAAPADPVPGHLSSHSALSSERLCAARS